MNTLKYTRQPTTIWQWLHSLFFPAQWRGEVTFPASWAEVRDKEILSIAPLLFAGEQEQLHCKVLILRKLLHIPWRVFGTFTAEQVRDMITELAWMFTTPMDVPVVKEFEFKGQIFHMPLPALRNVVAIEFATAEGYLRAFTDTSKPNGHALNQLVATLARPEKRNLDVNDPEFDGDVREKFNSRLVDYRADEFRNLDINVKMAVLKFFLGSVKTIQKKYGILYPEAEPNEDGTVSVAPSASMGLVGVLFDLAETGTFGDFEAVAFTNVHTVLTYLTKKKLEESQRRRNG